MSDEHGPPRPEAGRPVPIEPGPTEPGPIEPVPIEPVPIAGAGRVVTVPNAISAARLLGVPVFLYLLLGPHDDAAALAVLILAGVSDWADGVLARKLNQYSRLGELLDPAADRLYILATLIGLVLRNIIPWWLAAVIIGRDVVLAVALGVLRRYGYGPLPVHYLGKAATFNLLYAFPFLLLAARHGTVADASRPVAWAFTLWGTGLYLWAGGLYLIHTWQLVASVRRDPGPARDSGPAPTGAVS